jgi:hypothetical protein
MTIFFTVVSTAQMYIVLIKHGLSKAFFLLPTVIDSMKSIFLYFKLELLNKQKNI